MSKKNTALWLFLGFLVAACGRRGDPAPPVPVIPQAASDLVVTQRGTNVILRWAFPTLTAAGTKLPALRRLTVYRYVESLPVTEMGRQAPAADPGQIDPSRPMEPQLFARMPLLTPQQFNKLRERVATIEEKDIPAYTAGARVLFEDAAPLQSEDGRPVRIYYAVTAHGPAVESPISNVVHIVPLTPPSSPRALSVSARAEGIELTWEPPSNAGEVRPAGYNVYRFPPAGSIFDLGEPVNQTPVADTRFLDAPSYGSYRYLVTAVRDAGPPAVESDPTPTVLAEFKDLVAPGVPANVVTLREASAVRLIWDAVDAPDLAGYRIYREVGGGARTLLTTEPVVETTYRDQVSQLGVTYRYSVSSIDRNGNESALATAPEILLPR